MNTLEHIKIKEKFQDYILFNYKKLKELNVPKSCIFLDRDGVIIEDCHYIKNPKDVKLCPGAKDLIRNLHNKNYLIIIVTNQSGITKNLLTWKDYKEVSRRLIQLLGIPNPVNAIYANSYTDSFDGSWRKPNPGMLKQAAIDFSIDLNSSILIGDRKSDLDAGINAGIRNLIHVSTGHGEFERKLIEENIDKNGYYNFSNRKAKLLLIPNLTYFKKDIF